MAVLHRINTLIIVYLDKMLWIGYILQEAQMARHCNLPSLIAGFYFHSKKSVSTLTQKIYFLALLVDSPSRTLYLPKEKLLKVKKQCQ